MKRIFSLMLLCAAVVFAFGCKDDESVSDPVPVSGVTLDKATLSLEIGKTATLVATIAPKDAAVTAVVWSCDKPAIATVSDKGVVTAVAEGTAVITVKTEEAGKTATCTVTVTKAAIAVTEVKLSKTETTLPKGKTETLTVTVLPDDATDKTVTWTSSDPTVATVVEGVVTAVNTGTATITAAATDGSNVTGTCEVTVQSLIWAVGNLVADGANGAKIGTATDGGLYFQFGSLVGWSGGANGDGIGTPVNGLALEAKVTPNGYTNGTSWNSDWKGDPATDDVVTGTGDPCRYYLKGTWRLPTNDEYEKLFNDAEDSYADSGGWSWDASSASATNSTLGLALPAAGYRHWENSSLDFVGIHGSYYTSSPESEYLGRQMHVNSFDVDTQGYLTRSYACPVRCVQDPSN